MPDQPAPDPALDRDRLAAAVEAGNIPTLLMVLAHLTGDDRWLDDPYRPTRTRGLGEHDDGGLTAEAQAEVRAAAADAITAWHAGRPAGLPEPGEAQLQVMMSTCMGEPVPPEYASMMMVEMGFLRPPDQTTPRTGAGTAAVRGGPDDPAPASHDEFTVAIIGAGVAGLIAAVRLREAGIPFVVLEKNDDVGGTWLENRYPGAGVDTPSYIYSFSFYQRAWTSHYGKRDEVFRYVRDMADHYRLRDSISFGCEVTSAAFDDRTQHWTVRYTRTDGTTTTLTANAVITAVGLHNRPKVPNLPGLDSFSGPLFHTARWPADLDLGGRRVAVVGTGASAMQVVPAVADQVGHLTVFQRSPQWVAPAENYFTAFSPDVHWLMNHVPFYYQWYRFRLAWTFNDRNHAAFQKDPDWPHPERSLNRINDGHRRFFADYLRDQLAGRDDLIEKCLPDYPPFGKRILLDNGWYAALRRDDVTLVTEPVAGITATGVRTAGGDDHPADVIVLSTGFEQQRFLYPMQITGRAGADLRSVWEDDDARAYLGITTPGFPNLFMTYGPNTNPGGGSTIFILECQVHYIVQALQLMLDRGLAAIDCRREPFDDYNVRVDEAHSTMIWTHPGMDTYYRNSRGRVVTNMPWRVVDYWHMTRTVDLDDYTATPRSQASRSRNIPGTVVPIVH
ncbi:4-hydroxyacetophenone monooxygenase [Pseudonocardia endophytica]|uniref:4-hydroxyacetophenone monooxygenase n=1 Tax=Pseudonocardia endophytica TaxID=401976 RepID=A0A4R1HJS0_PSEEN|nr:4-hydroxyacetophenone monooxygenase [Pseudonocardia endophytica]